MDCNRNVIRIGNILYVKHDAVTCIREDEHCHSHIDDDKFKKNRRNYSAIDDKANDKSDFSNVAPSPTGPFTTTELSDDTCEYVDELSNCASQANDTEIDSTLQSELNNADFVDVGPQIKLEPLDIDDIYSDQTLNFISCTASCSSKTSQKYSSDNFSESFSTFKEPDIHQPQSIAKRNSQDNTDKPFVCSVCGYKCRLKGNLQKHMFRKHNPKAKQLTCKRCSNVFFKKSALQRHQSKCTHDFRNKIKEKRMKCEICGAVLMSKYSYKNHQIRMHNIMFIR